MLLFESDLLVSSPKIKARDSYKDLQNQQPKLKNIVRDRHLP